MDESPPFLKAILDKFQQVSPNQRFLIGLAGPPASGKSWWAERLAQLVNEHLGEKIATSFAMDAYHLYDEDLHQKGLYPFKGSHFTFDVAAFITKLIEIREAEGAVKCPIFDRSIDEPVQDKKVILANHRMVFVEGNYLLSRVFPWNAIRYLLDYSVFIEVDEEVQFKRLMERHLAIGRDEAEARAKIQRTDWVNSLEIRRDKDRAGCTFLPLPNKNS